MTSIAWKNGPILRSGAIGTGQACCCVSTRCNAQCSNGGLPESLVISITSVWRDPITSFDPIGDWLVYLQDDCGTYIGNYGSGGPFFAADNCAYNPCFGGCGYHLLIRLVLGTITADPYLRFIWSDDDGNERFVAGNLAFIDYQDDVCDRTLPVSGTTTGTFCANGNIEYTISLP